MTLKQKIYNSECFSESLTADSTVVQHFLLVQNQFLIQIKIYILKIKKRKCADLINVCMLPVWLELGEINKIGFCGRTGIYISEVNKYLSHSVR